MIDNDIYLISDTHDDLIYNKAEYKEIYGDLD